MVGGSAVAGFLASRFMKATSRDRFRGAKQGGYPLQAGAVTDSRRSVASTDETPVLPTGGNGSDLN